MLVRLAIWAAPELDDLRVPTAGSERPVMPMSACPCSDSYSFTCIAPMVRQLSDQGSLFARAY